MLSVLLSVLLIVFVFVSSSHATCVHGTTLMPRAEGNITLPTWGYDGETGPINWASMNNNYTACRTGTTQSPIVLTANITYTAEAPKWNLTNVEEADFENLGSTIEVLLSDGTLEYGGTVYKIKQFHMHTPSEHRINSEYFPLEVHFVHQSDAGDLAVVGILFELSEDGTSTKFITSTLTNLHEIVEPATTTKTGPLDFSVVTQAVADQKIFQYKGSLTTPPCKEGVQFLILETPMPIDVKSYNAIKRVLKFNSRFTQNVPGKENLLSLAADQAGRGSNSTGGSGGGRSEEGSAALTEPFVAKAVIAALLAALSPYLLLN
ncbi:putative carbonic anhydrase [Auriculariales sp. MPI-PUGE-AT-0066]|nr:putative carbonic anhydrase [Auriculariales sp. MPI-PUGE-AT-0066]